MNFRNSQFWGVAADVSSCPPENRPEIVFSGKSNVGKSTLINALCDNKKLARVSGTPGKTRLVVYFDVDRKIYFADLPGYGYAKAPKEIKAQFSKLADQYFASGRNITLVLHLIDVRHSPSAEDIQMLHYMNEHHLPYFIVFTKCDKFSKAQLSKQMVLFNELLSIDEDARVYCVSADRKVGLEDLRAGIAEYVEEQIEQ